MTRLRQWLTVWGLTVLLVAAILAAVGSCTSVYLATRNLELILGLR